ncbi:RNA polymerase subunit sigma-54 [Desulfosarcina ovata subsp. sediminis]|uniref:HTH-type transcriptional regulatory protein TyrR n=1 Tax=Desulfosarcina ovata subsp. sediminis TaxID=885957 RepID=A0A5K7ZY88_9BACT|nr:sigma 54-interacting transcriptional regulator [Desulfosarcina ovata]BBO85233.1 RNA polymerase subunit sigma-54 [Desulfosarcina ovata subsp. sediminis]
MKTAPHCVILIDAGGKIVESNAVPGSNAFQVGVVLPDAHPDLWLHVKQQLSGEPQPNAATIYSNGKTFRVWVTPLFRSGHEPLAVCVIENHTELDQMALKMRAFKDLSEELDAIIDSSDDGLWVCDAYGTVLRINAASERMNMVRAADIIGRSMEDLVEEGLIDRSVTIEVIRKRCRQNIIQRTRSGRKLILTGTPVFNDAGEIIRVVVSERDITEIDSLSRKLDEQMAIKDKMHHQIREMQLSRTTDSPLVARSPSMVKAVKQALKLSQVRTTVLILGESGTGKGLIANLIHQHSDRADKPMIEINCGAIPENLVETELFGYQKGAFTGADQKGKPGYLELAHQGTLFLDEIAELPLSSQVKLLRFLESARVTRVGGTSSRQLDVRILCATHQDLDKMMAEGRFREDLYYRLHVIPIHIPPLRERKACIPPLIQHYFNHFTKQLGIEEKTRISREAMDVLLAYPFPGNVRELVNLCERMVVMADENEIRIDDLPDSVLDTAEQCKADQMVGFQKNRSLAQMLAEAEQRILEQAKRRYGSQIRMARALGVNQSTIARKMKKYVQS